MGPTQALNRTEALLGAGTPLVFPGPPITLAYWHRLLFSVVECWRAHLLQTVVSSVVLVVSAL